MAVSVNDIAKLNDSSSYYLSDKGEIKEQGLLTKFKCFFNIGHSRQRVQNLVNEIQRSILQASGLTQSGTLRKDLNDLGTSRGITGAQIKTIFSNFKAVRSENFVKKDAMDAANNLIREQINNFLSNDDTKVFFPATKELSDLMRLALHPLTKNPPTKTEGGVQVLDKQTFNAAAENILNDLSRTITYAIDSQDLGMPVMDKAYLTYIKDKFYTVNGERKNASVNDLKAPGEAYAEHAMSLFRQKKDQEALRPIVDQLMPEVMKMDTDTQGIIIGNFQSIVMRGDNSIRDLESVKTRFDGFAANIRELQGIKNENPVLYDKLHASLSSTSSPIPSGKLTGMIEASKNAQLNFVKNMPENPTPMDLHKAVFQFMEAKDEIVDNFVGEFAKSGADEQMVSERIVISLLLSQLSDKEATNLLRGFAHPSASELNETYSNFEASVNDYAENMTAQQKENRTYIAANCKTTIDNILIDFNSSVDGAMHQPIPDHIGSLHDTPEKVFADIDRFVANKEAA